MASTIKNLDFNCEGVFIAPGGIKHFNRLPNTIRSRVVGVLINEEIQENDILIKEAQRETSARIVTLCTLACPVPRATFSEKTIKLYELCLAELLADTRTHFLATRARIDSPQNNVLDIECAVANSIHILNSVSPKKLISSSTPHSLGAWIFGRCAELMEVSVIVLEMSPVRDRAWALLGMDEQRVLPLNVNNSNPETPSEAVLALVRPQIEATPGSRDSQGVPVSRMELGTIKGSDGNCWWSLGREMRLALEGSLIRIPAHAIQSWLKFRLYQSYQSLAIKKLPSCPFVVFFLHYQPERTTLPEGYGFTQQLLAIRVLSLGIPSGWRLLVREHPSTWLKRLNPTVRRLDYYRSITKFGNVDLCSMDRDTFELIDRAVAVSTITGKVGFQALARGKPVFTFGAAGYRDHPGCFSVRSVADVNQACVDIVSPDGFNLVSRKDFNRYLGWVEANSVRSEYRGDDVYELRLRNFELLYKNLLKNDS